MQERGEKIVNYGVFQKSTHHSTQTTLIKVNNDFYIAKSTGQCWF